MDALPAVVTVVVVVVHVVLSVAVVTVLVVVVAVVAWCVWPLELAVIALAVFLLLLFRRTFCVDDVVVVDVVVSHVYEFCVQIISRKTTQNINTTGGRT